MSSFAIGPSGADARGSGGKILLDRPRPTPLPSPYFRPQPPSPRPQTRTWFSGLVSGAGKLLSAVFLPSPSAPLSESESASHDDDNDSDNDFVSDDGNNGDDILSKHVKELGQNGVSQKSNNKHTIGMEPVLQKSEAKHTIEHLIRQETFSWDECIELTKIIESRVVDSPAFGAKDATQKKLHDWSFKSKYASLGAWGSPSQAGNSSELFPYSASRLGTLSCSASAMQTQSPDIRDIAVMEARKWIEDKKMEPCPKSELELESSVQSKVILPRVSGGEMSSPVDVAKSYMRGQSPWASSALKRSSLAFGSWDAADESRRIRLKLNDDFLERHEVGQIDSSIKTKEHETVHKTSVADQREAVSIMHDSNCSPLVKSADAAVGSCCFCLKLTDDVLEPPAVTQIESSVKTMEHEMVQSTAVADKGKVVSITDDLNSLVPVKSVEDSSGKATEHATVQSTSVADKGEVVSIIHDSNSLPSLNSADASCGFLAELSAAQDGVTLSNEKSVEVHDLVPDNTVDASHLLAEFSVVQDGVNSSDGKLVEVNTLVPDDAVVLKNSDTIGNTSDSKIHVIESEEVNLSNAVEERDSHLGQTVQPKDHLDLNETDATDSISQGGDDFQMQDRPASKSDAAVYFPLSSAAELNGDPSTNHAMEEGKIDGSSIGPSHTAVATSSIEEDCQLSSEASLEIPEIQESNNSVDGVENGKNREQEKILPVRRAQRLKSSNGGKKVAVGKGRIPQSLSGPSSSDGQEVKPIKSKAIDEPSKPEHQPNSTRISISKSSSGGVKPTTTSGYARRGRAKGK